MQKADHGQGGGGTSTRGREHHKFFVIKISTPKSLRLNILPSIFANPRQLRLLEVWEEGGTPKTRYRPGEGLTIQTGL
jgi:hypothetical protein